MCHSEPCTRGDRHRSIPVDTQTRESRAKVSLVPGDLTGLLAAALRGPKMFQVGPSSI